MLSLPALEVSCRYWMACRFMTQNATDKVHSHVGLWLVDGDRAADALEVEGVDAGWMDRQAQRICMHPGYIPIRRR